MSSFVIVVGALSLLLGLGGDWSNWLLARSQRVSSVSPLVLAPLLFNWFGLMLILIILQNHDFLLWASLALGLLALHCVGLRGRIV